MLAECMIACCVIATSMGVDKVKNFVGESDPSSYKRLFERDVALKVESDRLQSVPSILLTWVLKCLAEWKFFSVRSFGVRFCLTQVPWSL